MNKSNIINLLKKARYYHNYSCEEEKAMELCNKVLKKDPKNRDAMLIKAGSLHCLDREKESFQLVTEIIEKWPDHWEAYYLMGLLLFNTNEEKAIENFNKSIKLKKTFDNTISAAQLLYFLEDNIYKEYLKQAKKLDLDRYKNYMKKLLGAGNNMKNKKQLNLTKEELEAIYKIEKRDKNEKPEKLINQIILATLAIFGL